MDIHQLFFQSIDDLHFQDSTQKIDQMIHLLDSAKDRLLNIKRIRIPQLPSDILILVVKWLPFCPLQISALCGDNDTYDQIFKYLVNADRKTYYMTRIRQQNNNRNFQTWIILQLNDIRSSSLVVHPSRPNEISIALCGITPDNDYLDPIINDTNTRVTLIRVFTNSFRMESLKTIKLGGFERVCLTQCALKKCNPLSPFEHSSKFYIVNDTCVSKSTALLYNKNNMTYYYPHSLKNSIYNTLPYNTIFKTKHNYKYLHYNYSNTTTPLWNALLARNITHNFNSLSLWNTQIITTNSLPYKNSYLTHNTKLDTSKYGYILLLLTKTNMSSKSSRTRRIIEKIHKKYTTHQTELNKINYI